MLEARDSISLMISLSYSGCSPMPKALRVISLREFIKFHRPWSLHHNQAFPGKIPFFVNSNFHSFTEFFPLVSLHKAAEKHLLVAYLLPRLPRQPFNFPFLERRLERQSSAQLNWKIGWARERVWKIGKTATGKFNQKEYKQCNKSWFGEQFKCFVTKSFWAFSRKI